MEIDTIFNFWWSSEEKIYESLPVSKNVPGIKIDLRTVTIVSSHIIV